MSVPDVRWRVEITSITIIRLRQGMDRVSLHTTLPDSSYADIGSLDMNFPCPRGSAEDYVKRNFPGVPFHIIEAGA